MNYRLAIVLGWLFCLNLSYQACTRYQISYQNLEHSNTENLVPLEPSFRGISGADQVQASSVRISWEPVPWADHYKVYSVVYGRPVFLTQASSGRSEVTVDELVEGSNYRFEVRAFAKDGRTQETQRFLELTTPLRPKVRSLRFDGIMASIRTATIADLIASNPGANAVGGAVATFSMCFWHKMDEDPRIYRAVAGATKNGGWGDGMGFYWQSADTFRFFVNNYSGQGIETKIDNPLNWNFFCGTFDNTQPTDYIKLYVNGQAAVATKSAPGPVQAIDSTSILTLGELSSYTYNIHGGLDEVSFWNRELSAGEIRTLFMAGRSRNVQDGLGSTTSQSLVAYWRLGDNSSNIAEDSGPGQHHGQLVSMDNSSISEEAQNSAP